MTTPARPTKAAPTHKPVALLKALGDPSNTTNVRVLFDQFDVNHNGTIEQNELKNLLLRIYAHPKFGSDDISDVADDMVKALTNAVDINQDGVLQFSEFIHAIQIICSGDDGQS
eukprot:TRINITY_DN10889_c0_g1_i6.p1 TRINITY_DN10889_c0_g1~~TRINITY_DN10889_c0_g1_i6.p1  ORF type:complete len:131 (-),score=28.84 TRINITY_DN10889_c0_g1_i6:80-421(-)